MYQTSNSTANILAANVASPISEGVNNNQAVHHHTEREEGTGGTFENMSGLLEDTGDSMFRQTVSIQLDTKL